MPDPLGEDQTAPSSFARALSGGRQAARAPRAASPRPCRQAAALVDGMNERLKEVRTASEVAVQLVWEVDPDLPASASLPGIVDSARPPGHSARRDRRTRHALPRRAARRTDRAPPPQSGVTGRRRGCRALGRRQRHRRSPTHRAAQPPAVPLPHRPARLPGRPRRSRPSATDEEVEAVGLRTARAADAAEALVQGHRPGIAWPLLAEAALALRAGVPWVACNLDVTLPTERGARQRRDGRRDELNLRCPAVTRAMLVCWSCDLFADRRAISLPGRPIGRRPRRGAVRPRG